MTKRIIALVLVAIMAAVALVACAEDPATTPTTAPEGTPTAPAGTPTAPATTPDEGTPTPTPTEPDEPTPVLPEDPFEQWGGYDAQWGTGSVYGQGFECWPFAGNNQYCPRAFWQFTLTLSLDEGDFTENVNNPTDYKYTWKLWYKDSEADPYDTESWKGPFEVYLETFYAFGGDNPNVIYRLQTSDSPQGDPCKNFELGKSYDLIFQVLNDEEALGFTMVSFNWTSRVDAEYKVYNDFWKSRDRQGVGYTAADQTITDADIAFAESVGFTTDANGNVTYTDPNAQ